MNPVLVKASSNVFINFIKLRNSASYNLTHTYSLTHAMLTTLVFSFQKNHRPRSLLSRLCLPLEKKHCFASPRPDPVFLSRESLDLQPKPVWSDFILLSKSINNNELSVALRVISLNYQFKIITSLNIRDACCSLTCKVALEMPAWVCPLDRSPWDFGSIHHTDIQISITDLLKLKTSGIQ